ncbi:MAG: hypothetical protein GY822_21435 [Deltaproteobacteria bacterium]|nr:hypothetical protein [Deltaproteobacteria bacterium]
MQRFIVLLPFLLGLAVLTGCGDFEAKASLTSCESDAECVEVTDGEFDVCGQEGQDLCCVGGFFKCGCTTRNTCENGNVCYECSESICPSVQTTICLDATSGGLFGLTSIEETTDVE